MGTKLGSKATQWLLTKMEDNKKEDGSVYCDNVESAVLLGLIKRQYQFTPIQLLKQQTDFL